MILNLLFLLVALRVATHGQVNQICVLLGDTVATTRLGLALSHHEDYSVLSRARGATLLLDHDLLLTFLRII